MYRRDEPVREMGCGEERRGERGEQSCFALLFVPETEAFDRVTLREPARADVLVPVRGDDVLLVGGKDESGQEGCVAQDERSTRRVFVRREKVVVVRGGNRRGCGQRRQRVTWKYVSTGRESVRCGRAWAT